MIQVKKYSIKTQLHEFLNQEIIDYFEKERHFYNFVFRVAWHQYNNGYRPKLSDWNTELQLRFDILKRVANSIIKEVIGAHNRTKELKRYELKLFKYKIKKLDQQIFKLQTIVDTLKSTVNEGPVPKQYHNLKRKLVALKMRKDRYIKANDQRRRQIDHGKFNLCFGSKKLGTFEFLEQRDKNICLLGSKDESSQNQLLQLKYNKYNNQFEIQLRALTKDRNYYRGRCYFKYQQSLIKRILKTKESPLSYRIVKENNRYYLICTFEITQETLTNSFYGNIGIDFNKGFIAVAETNEFGHLVNTKRYDYRFGQGDKTQADLREIASKICNEALELGKDINVEDLNFTSKKAQVTGSKKYNHMLHTLAYRLFLDAFDNAGYRNGVLIKWVNPAWTSYEAKEKYCNPMKLNIHMGAAYVIANR